MLHSVARRGDASSPPHVLRVARGIPFNRVPNAHSESTAAGEEAVSLVARPVCFSPPESPALDRPFFGRIAAGGSAAR